MAFVAARYALRSVGRNLRRTALSVVGIGIGCALALFMESINRGRDELFARAGTYSGVGHLRVVPAGWQLRRDPRMRLADWRADLAAVRAHDDVAAATVRVRTQALLAMGTHVVPVEMVGVDPSNEPRTNRLVGDVRRGRYLRPGDRGVVVVGRAIADRLSVELDDDVLVNAVGRGGHIESAMLRIVGIIETGSDDVDASVCHAPIEEVARLTGLSGVGEVAVVLDDWRRAGDVRAGLARTLVSGDAVLTWTEIVPELAGHLEQDKAASRMVRLVILLIVLLGVASAQLASVLERRREFAVLSAIGMRGAQMARLLLLEAAELGLAGAVLGLAIGLPLVWRLARDGIDFRAFMGGSSTVGGAIIEPIIYGDFGWWILPFVLVVAFGMTVLASLYPAWFATRTDPAVALRVAQ